MRNTAFLLFSFALLSGFYVAALNSGMVLIKSQSQNQYLRMCAGCDKGKDLVKLDSKVGRQSRWTIEVRGSQVAFKAYNGKYLRRCGKDCTDQNFIVPEDTSILPESMWYYRQHSKGLWIFNQAKFEGRYHYIFNFGICFNCLKSQEKFLQINGKSGPSSPIPYWILEQFIPFPTGRIMLKSSNEKFLTNCNNGCGPGSYPDSATVLAKSVGDPSQIWEADQVEDKIALRNMNGKYLSRCKFCWAKQSVYVHSSSYSQGPWVLWTPERLANGNWALKGDNGKYLTYCTACSVVPIASTDRTVDEYAFVNLDSSTDAKTQWQIVVL